MSTHEPTGRPTRQERPLKYGRAGAASQDRQVRTLAVALRIFRRSLLTAVALARFSFSVTPQSATGSASNSSATRLGSRRERA